MLLGIIALAILWFNFIPLLNLAANYWLKENGFEGSHLEITEAGKDRFAIAEASLSGPGWKVHVADLELDYELSRLWETWQADHLRIGSIEASVNPDALDKKGNDQDSLNFDPDWLGYFPSKGVEVESFNVEVQLKENAYNATGSLQLSPTEGQSLDANLNLNFNNLQTHLTGVVEPSFPLNFKIQTESPDPLKLVESLLPDWRSQFQVPEDLDLSVGGLQADIQVSIDSLETFQTTTNLKLDFLSATLGNRSVRLSESQVILTTTGKDQISGTFNADLEEALVKAFRIGPQMLKLDFSTTGLEGWKLATAQSLAWEYDVDTSTGVSGFTGVIQTGETLKIAGVVVTPQLFLSGLPISASEADIVFEGDTLSYQLSDLSPTDYPSVRLTGGNGKVVLNADETIDISFQAELGPNAMESFLPGSSLTPLNLKSVTTVLEETLEVKLDIEPVESGPIFTLPEVISGAGHLKSHIEASRPLDGLTWTGSLTSEVSDMKLTGGSWNLSEGSFSGTFKFDRFNQKIYLVEQRPLIDHLIGALSGSVTVTANQLSAGGMTAQWIYSQLDFGKAEGSNQLRSQLTATAGTLTAGPETVNQINTEVSVTGDPDNLQSTGTVGFLYQGIEGNLSFSQTTSNLLGSPYMTGEYSLSPMQFDYSDLIGKHVPAVHDLSFSGNLSASGNYRYSEHEADATVDLAFNEGSVDLPSSKLTASGIEAHVSLNSIKPLKGNPGKSSLHIGKTDLGDLVLFNSEVLFDPLDWNTIRLEKARTAMFGGEIYAEPATIHLNPVSASSALHFEHLSLNAITSMISIFNGSMEGYVTGKIPLTFTKGRFQVGEGFLGLSQGEKARLYYDSSGIFGKPGPEVTGQQPTFADRFLEKLQLQPESVVENVLSDLAINEFRVDLFPSNTPLTPIRIRFSGEGKSGETKVPLTLDTNINGTLDELFNFLLQINSLGSPVLQ
ncbi:MAG: YdbH domain-containing protein [Verrucomicrobiae bacterium]|nr:YdbH domain-containing protein [Verrucomicrobiae bacterium]